MEDEHSEPDAGAPTRSWMSDWRPSLLAGAVLLGGLCWYVLLSDPSPLSPAAWLPMLLTPVIAAYAAGRTAGSPGLSPAARRVWARQRLCFGLIVAGTAVDVVVVVPEGEVARQSAVTPTVLLYTIAFGVMIWAVLRLPVEQQSGPSPRVVLAGGLDLSVVVVAGVMFGAYFILRNPSSEGAAPGSPWIVLTLMTLTAALVLVFGKAALTQAGVLDGLALTLLALGALVAAIGTGIAIIVVGMSYFSAGEVLTPVTSFLAALSADRQRWTSAAVAPERAQGRWRPWAGPLRYLPYVAILATSVLLLAVTADLHAPDRAVVVFAIMITGLVVLRQLLILAENTRLVGRLNASMVELARQEQRFRALVQYSSDVILVTDADGKLQYLSPSVERILGVRADDWVGRDVNLFTHPEDWPALQESVHRLSSEPRDPVTLQLRVAHADGTWRWLEIIAVNRLADPAVAGVVGSARDITETRRTYDELSREARHDPLTGLPNRVLFTEQLAAAMVDGERTGPEMTLLLVNLDDFKSINDRLGHVVGDALLVVLAGRLRDCVSDDDLVARLGGDEFAVLLPSPPERHVGAVIDEIGLAFGTPLDAIGHDLLVQASMGQVRAEAGMDPGELMRRANVALHTAKEQGKGGCLRYSEEMDRRAVEYARIGADLQRAMAAGELHVVFQPVVSLPERRLVGVEALLRWNHPHRGAVSPVEFIPVAERTGQIVPLGSWVLTKSCRQLADWRAHAAAPFPMSVNVSARQLREPGFAELVVDTLERSGLRPDDLIIEITETAVFEGGAALDAVRRLHDLGVGIAFDDFGTGHSSLGLLRSCPVDVLKVDRMFVEGVTGTPRDAAVATSIVHIAHAMGLRAVAEGVETEEQAEGLRRLGYRYAQGYLFARPLVAAELTELLVSGSVPAGVSASPPVVAPGRAGGVRPA